MTRSVFARGEVTLAHTVYGLILTLATVGELLHEEVAAGIAVAWLLGAGVVLLGAHMFSDVLAHVATTHDEPDWSEILSIGREDVSVIAGALGAALITTVAALADLDSEGALRTCVVAGLVVLAALCFFGLPQHRMVVRVVTSAVGVTFGAAIVLLENTFSAPWRRPLDQVELPRRSGCLGAARDSELGVDVARVRLDGVA